VGCYSWTAVKMQKKIPTSIDKKSMIYQRILNLLINFTKECNISVCMTKKYYYFVNVSFSVLEWIISNFDIFTAFIKKGFRRFTIFLRINLSSFLLFLLSIHHLSFPKYIKSLRPDLTIQENAKDQKNLLFQKGGQLFWLRGPH
jgi:hypothetical protein